MAGGEFYTPEASDLTASLDLGLEKTKGIKRAENPLLYPLVPVPALYSRFFEITGNHIATLGGEPLRRLFSQDIPDEKQDYSHSFTVIEIHYSEFTETTYKGLKNLLAQVSQTKTLQERDITLSSPVDPKFTASYMITPDVEEAEGENPYLSSGLFFRRSGVVAGKESGNGIPTRGFLDLRISIDDGQSEVLTAYEAVIASLILAGKLDFSTPEAIVKSLPQRRELFMDIYQNMLREFMPGVSREQIDGVDDQVDDIDTNLYSPLKTGKGIPMNTLLVGAPGTGKSMMGRYFMSDRSVLTVPTGISKLDHFEHYTLPHLTAVKNIIDLPVVVFVDDVEGLLEAGLSRNSSGETIQYVDPRSRAHSLSLLERMQDTYDIYLLCTLNHPDVEAAFLRRFNSVYFPLPSVDQRRSLLGKVIPAGQLNADKHSAVVEDIASRSEGYNYNSVALISEYLENLLSKIDHEVSQEEFMGLVDEAVNKAGQRADIEGLKAFDESAKRMLGIKQE